MAYATEPDLIASAGGKRRLDQLLSKQPPTEAPDARAYWIAEALRRGDAKINAYLPSRYATPLQAPNDFIRQLAADEAVYFLASAAGMVTAHEQVMAEERLHAYRDLRDGKIWPGDPAPTPTTGRKSVVVQSRGRGALRRWKGFV